MMKIKLILTIQVLLLFLISCESTSPEIESEKELPKTESGVSVGVERYSCRYAWIDIKVPTGGRNIEFVSDLTTEIDTFIYSDTTLFVENLTPGKNYGITINCPETEVYIEETINYEFRTLDTTSHNFSYEIYEFTDGLGNRLSGVDVIDANNIWAVGELHKNDTLYNIARWDGANWNIEKASALFREEYITLQLEGIKIFDAEHIWLSGSLPIYGKKDSWELYSLRDSLEPNISVSIGDGERWDEMYLAGRGPTVIKYDHGSWELYDKGTDLRIYDILVSDGDVYCAANSHSMVRSQILKKAKDKTVFEEIKEFNWDLPENELYEKLSGDVLGIWMDENNTLYSAGLFLYSCINGQWEYMESLSGNYYGNHNVVSERGLFTKITGTASNDMVVVGDRGTVMHYNGSSWQHIGPGYNSGSNIIYHAVSMEGNTICAVGVNGNLGYVILLNR